MLLQIRQINIIFRKITDSLAGKTLKITMYRIITKIGMEINTSKLFFLFGLLLLNMRASGQSITFQKTILAPDIEYFTSVVQTPDEGYIAVGRKRESGIRDDMYIVRYDKFGDTLWNKTINVELAECIVKTLDNNYVICGHIGSLVKIDLNGNILKLYVSSNQYLIVNKIIQIDDGSFFVAGMHRQSVDAPYFAKFDANLNLVFDTLYTASRFSGSFNDLIFSNDKNLVLVGAHTVVNGSPSYMFIGKVSQSGYVLWESTFYEKPYLLPRTICVADDESYYVGGYKFFAKFNSSANKQWFKNVDSNYSNEIRDLKISADNKIVMAGWYDSAGTAFARIRKIDTNGTNIWVNSFGFTNFNNEAWEIDQTKDSGFIVVGRTEIQEEDPYILKIDRYGQLNPLGVNVISTHIPFKSCLHQNYPNPFNPVTKIKFDISGTSVAQTFLSVYDINGKEISLLVNTYLKPGSYEVSFDATRLSSGVYFCKISVGSFTDVKKMVLLK